MRVKYDIKNASDCRPDLFRIFFTKLYKSAKKSVGSLTVCEKAERRDAEHGKKMLAEKKLE